MLPSERLIPRRALPVQRSDMSIYRDIAKGSFPAPATTINGFRYWREGDVIAWYEGKRSGWSAEANETREPRTHRTAAARAVRSLAAHARTVTPDIATTPIIIGERQ
jgi:predicted DNA-binding transcriptional regulator AlpA